MMARKNTALVYLYIATSLDGYIARMDGSVDWLHEVDNPEQSDYGYKEFLQKIDLIVMGRKTYDVVNGFDIPWPYNMPSYVVTRNAHLTVTTPQTYVLPDPDQHALEKLRRRSEKGIWLMGGGELVRYFLAKDLIDEIILCVIPRILGAGIPLFSGTPPDTELQLVHCEPYPGGPVILTYRPKR